MPRAPRVEEGIVPGGGVALLWCQKVLDKVKGSDDDEKIGVDIVRRSLEEPMRMIVQNAGAEASIVVGKVKESKDKNFGYNARPTSSRTWWRRRHRSHQGHPHRVADAASIAALMLTTECVVVEKKEKDKTPPMPGGGGGMGGMY